jgi:hypothetical protein
LASGALAGLPDARVDPEIADQLLGGREAVDVPDRGDQGRGGRDVDPGDRHQPFDLGALEGLLGELAVDVRDLGGEEIDLAQARLDGVALVAGEFELGEPPAAAFTEQVTHRRAAFQVVHEHGGDLVLRAGPLTHQLRPPGGESAQHTRALIADPHPRNEIRGEQLGECASVELVVLDLRVADRADVHRVRDHHLAHERFEHPCDLERVAGALEDHLVVGQQALTEHAQLLRGACDAAS